MSFLKNFGKSVDSAVKKTVERSKDLSEIARLNSDIVKLKAKIEMEYSEIGENAYKAYSEGVENVKMSESLEIIKDLFAQIEEKKEEILVVKGITICPQCGAELDMICVYCGTCGTKIDR